jgi:hypothetical protein
MSFSYHVKKTAIAMHTHGLQYLRVRYQSIELKDAVVFDLGTSSESEVTGVPEFTRPEFVQTFSLCLDRISFDPFCAANKSTALAAAQSAFESAQYTSTEYSQLIANLNAVWSPEYATSANIAGWEVYVNRWIAVKTMGDRTEDVAKYYLKLGTLGQL